MSIIAIPFGWLMKLCYIIVKNYGFALILFTFITKLIMFPLQIKQQKMSAKTAKLNPKLQKLKQKYGNNKEKYNEELTKLYAEEGVSMTGGCLPLVISMVLLFAMIEIIYAPFTYVTSLADEKVDKASSLVTNMMTVSYEIRDAQGLGSFTKLEEASNGSVDEIYAYMTSDDHKKEFKKSLDLSEDDLKEILTIFDEREGLDEYFADSSKVTQNLQNRPELLIFRVVEDGKNGEIDSSFLDSEVIAVAEDFNYEMFGVFLGDYPSWKSVLVLIPILSLVFQLLVTVVSQHYTKKNNMNANQPGMGGMTAMLYILPIFSFWIAFNFPAGIGLYWIAQSVFSLIQVIIVNKVFTPEYIDKLNEKEAAKKKKKGKKSFMERALEVQQLQQNSGAPVKKDEDEGLTDEEKKLSKAELKQLQRKRLNDARKRYAEKYGDVYDEDENS